MSKHITERTLGEIKKQAKARRKADQSLTHCQYLDIVAKEFGVGSFHEASMLCKKGMQKPATTPFDPLDGMMPDERQAYYERMAYILGREILEIYPESNDYFSDADFDDDEY